MAGFGSRLICLNAIQSLSTPCTLSFLRAVIPISSILLSLLFVLPYPSLLRRLFSPIASIVYDGTSLRNIAPPAYEEKLKRHGKEGPPSWVHAVLVGGGLIGSLWWMAIMGLNVMEITSARAGKQDIVWKGWTSGLVALSWVSTGSGLATALTTEAVALYSFTSCFNPFCDPLVRQLTLRSPYTQPIFPSPAYRSSPFFTYVLPPAFTLPTLATHSSLRERLSRSLCLSSAFPPQ